jgi:hypothetical protein
MSSKPNTLWTNTTSFGMLAVYIFISKIKDCRNEINVTIWGVSAKLVASYIQVQTEVLEMICKGSHLETCKDFSDVCGISDELTNNKY